MDKQQDFEEAELEAKEKESFAKSLAAFMAYHEANGKEVKFDNDGTEAMARILAAMPRAKEIYQDIDIQAIKERLRKAPYKGLTFDELLRMPGGKYLKEWKEAKTEAERNAIAIEAMYDGKAPTLYEQLIFGAYQTRKKVKQRTEKVNIPLASKQDFLSIITAPGYNNSFKLGRGTNKEDYGVRYIAKALEGKSKSLEGRQMDLSDFVDLKDLYKVAKKTDSDKEKPIKPKKYNEAFITYIYSCFKEAAEQNGGQFPTYIGVKRSDLSCYRGKEEDGEHSIEKDITDYQSAMRKGTDGTYYAIISLIAYKPEIDTYILTSPYMQQIFYAIDKSSVKRNKKGEVITKRNGEPVREISYNKKIISGDLKNERDFEAITDVIEIVRIIAASGAKGRPNISARELMQRNEPFAIRYQESKNKSQLLARHYSNVWKYLEKHAGAQLRKQYKGIRLPNGTKPGPEWIPTPRTLNDIIFQFSHSGSEIGEK